MKELIAALLLTFIFPVAGFSKITNFNATALGMKNMTKLKSLPDILFKLAIFGAILIEFISPLIIVGNIFNYTSNKLAKLSVIVLIIFTILASLIYHFPTHPGQKNYFMKNIAIIGGLMSYYLLL